MTHPLSTNPTARPAPAELPRWPMVTRSAEQILQEIWRINQLERGRCWASYRHLGQAAGVQERQAGNLIRQLIADGWILPAPQKRGHSKLMRVRLPSPEQMLGRSKPRQNVAYLPRQFIAGEVGNSLPTKRELIHNSDFGGNPPSKTSPPASPKDRGDAPLFDPPARVNLWEAHQRLAATYTGPGTAPICHTLEQLVRRGEVQNVKLDGRMRAIGSANVTMRGATPTIRIVLPRGQGCEVRDWYDEHLLKLEFYP